MTRRRWPAASRAAANPFAPPRPHAQRGSVTQPRRAALHHRPPYLAPERHACPTPRRAPTPLRGTLPVRAPQPIPNPVGGALTELAGRLPRRTHASHRCRLQTPDRWPDRPHTAYRRCRDRSLPPGGQRRRAELRPSPECRRLRHCCRHLSTHWTHAARRAAGAPQQAGCASECWTRHRGAQCRRAARARAAARASRRVKRMHLSAVARPPSAGPQLPW